MLDSAAMTEYLRFLRDPGLAFAHGMDTDQMYENLAGGMVMHPPTLDAPRERTHAPVRMRDAALHRAPDLQRPGLLHDAPPAEDERRHPGRGEKEEQREKGDSDRGRVHEADATPAAAACFDLRQAAQ